MYNQGTGLPVPADQPLNQNFVQQLPGYPQTPMASGLPPQEVVEVHTSLVNAIQAGVQKGPIRIFMFNLLAADGYNNQLYADVLDAALEYHVALKSQRMSQNPAAQAAEETLRAEIPLVVDRYPALMGYMNQQQQYELQGYRQLRDQIAGLCRQLHQPQQPQPMYGQPQQPQPAAVGQPYQPPGGGYQQPQPMGGGMQRPPMGQPMGQPMGMQRPPMGQPVGQPMRPGAHHAPMGPGGGQPSRSMLDNQQNNQPMSNQGGPRRPVVGATSVAGSNVMNSNEGEDMRRVSQTDREIGHLMGVQAAKESESHGKYAPAIDRPVEFVSKRYVPARRSDQRIVKSQDGGEVTYSIINVGDDMNYQDHETDTNMVKLSRQTEVGPKIGIPADWSKASLPNEVNKDDENLDLEFDEPVALKEFVDAYSMSQARVEAERKLAAKGVTDNEGRVVESYANMRTPIVCSPEDNEAFSEMMKASQDLTQLIDGMVRIKDDVNPTLWYEAHDRMTATFNRRLKAGLGLYDWKIDSITEDYADALDALGEEFKHVAVDRFKTNVFATLKNALLSVYSDEAGVISLIEPVCISQLPWSSTDIDLVLESEYAMLSAGANSHFFTAAERLFKRTNVKDLSVNRRFFVTADNVWIELHVGDLSAETLLISKIERQ